jgi:hypothetical protein
MKRDEIRAKAKALGIKTKVVKKADLIRQIQKAEGNFDCFGLSKDNGDEGNGCFGEDCLPSINFSVSNGWLG